MQPLEVYYLINAYNTSMLKSNKYNSRFWQHSLIMNNTETYLEDENDDLEEYWIRRTGGYSPGQTPLARYFFNCQTTEYIDRRAFIPDSVQSIVTNPQPTNTPPVIDDHLMGSALIPEFMEIIKEEIGADAIYSEAASGVRLVDNYNQRMDINNAFRYFDELWNTIRNGVKTTRVIEYDEDGSTQSDETTTVDIDDDYSTEALYSKSYDLDEDEDYYLSGETIITVTYDFDFAYRDNLPSQTPFAYPWYEVDLFENVRLYRKSKTQSTDFLYEDAILIVEDEDTVTVQAPEPIGTPSEGSTFFSNTIAYYRATFEMKNLSVAGLANMYGLPY